ncbi:MAG: hypothetical protein LBU19_08470 [Treponema sp.]|jgi:hypothetical protein|nr:hypothetical protein [Treponema sp.]
MRRWVLVFLILFFHASLFGAEYTDGRIRLVLHPQIGRFSLYYLVDPSRQNYEAMFMDQDPRTSVLTLSYNGKAYRLGESPEFTVREGGTPQAPALIFESSFVTVTEEFNFIATGSSGTANGVWISFVIENKSRRRIQAGLRVLLDTKLGETGSTHFSTDIRSIEEEMILDASTQDKFWISGPPREFSLMGSVSASVNRIPERIHIANWKRLNDVPWTLEFAQGRKFNNPPYSIRDSALAYYYEPVRIDREGNISFSLLLASWDPQGFSSLHSLRVPRNPGQVFETEEVEEIQAIQAIQAIQEIQEETPIFPDVNPAIARSDYNALLNIIEQINAYLDSGVPISDDDIASIEQDLNRIRSRYIGQ